MPQIKLTREERAHRASSNATQTLSATPPPLTSASASTQATYSPPTRVFNLQDATRAVLASKKLGPELSLEIVSLLKVAQALYFYYGEEFAEFKPDLWQGGATKRQGYAEIYKQGKLPAFVLFANLFLEYTPAERSHLLEQGNASQPYLIAKTLWQAHKRKREITWTED